MSLHYLHLARRGCSRMMVTIFGGAENNVDTLYPHKYLLYCISTIPTKKAMTQLLLQHYYTIIPGTDWKPEFQLEAKITFKRKKKNYFPFFSHQISTNRVKILLMFSVDCQWKEKNEKQWVQSYLSQYISVTIVWRGKWLEMNLKVYWLKILHREFFVVTLTIVSKAKVHGLCVASLRGRWGCCVS